MSSPPGSTVSTPRSRRSSKRGRPEEETSTKGTPSKRGRSEDAPSERGTPSRRSARSTVQENGTTPTQNGTSVNGTSANGHGTPGRRSTRGSEAGTPSRRSARGQAASEAGTPGRRSTRGKTASEAGTPRQSRRGAPGSSPPSKRLDSSPGGDLAPMPSSPASGRSNDIHETSLFSSPGHSKVGASEIDLSSPLNYGTPSSRMSGTPGRGAGTPIRPRNDIRSERKVRQVNLASDPSGEPTEPMTGGPTSDQPGGPQLVIWGTDVVVNEAKEKFCRFLKRFIDPDADQAEGVNPDEPYYLQKLDEIQTLELPFLNVNCKHLQEFDNDLYRKLVSYPQEVIPTFDMAVNEMFFERYPDTVLDHQIQVRTYNAEKTKNMRSLNPEDIDQLITICGMVIRTSNLMPEMREAFFRCYVCSATASVEIDRGRIAEPAICRNCQTKHSMGLIHNRSQFSDKQMVKLQEAPDDMPAGQTPHTVVLYAHNDLVDTVQPGDRVTVTGIYRATPLRVNPRMRNVKAVYKTYIDVIQFCKDKTGRLHENTGDKDDDQITFTDERKEELVALSKKDDIYDCLAKALAPSIFENEDIKKGILCQLFGASNKDFEDTGRSKFRSEINILLCGDPGTSKSQLLQYVHHLVPRGQYTSGKGSSAVGLTAYITKDPETRQLVLQTGALVLSDNGICCIDEFDKMNDSTRSVLHEVMEQQTLSIAKAGIICSLNARTSILAAANPVDSQWNPKKTIIDNIQLPHTLLSRFDLIFLILDPQDEIFDRRLANHLVSLYHQGKKDTENEHLDMSVLRDYISYARTYVTPKLSEESSQMLVQAYVEMRKIGSAKGMVSAYPRQLESLIRLSEAHARMRFSNKVEPIDVEEARRLHYEALKQAAFDPRDGTINMDILGTGMSDAARKQQKECAEGIKKYVDNNKGKQATFKYTALLEEFRQQSDLPISRDLFDGAIKILVDEEYFFRSGNTLRKL